MMCQWIRRVVRVVAAAMHPPDRDVGCRCALGWLGEGGKRRKRGLVDGQRLAGRLAAPDSEQVTKEVVLDLWCCRGCWGARC